MTSCVSSPNVLFPDFDGKCHEVKEKCEGAFTTGGKDFHLGKQNS